MPRCDPTRAWCSTWKDGVFFGEAFLDDDGHGRSDIRIAAKVTKNGSDIEVDLSNSDPQSTGSSVPACQYAGGGGDGFCI